MCLILIALRISLLPDFILMTPMGRLYVGSFASALTNWDFTTILTLLNTDVNWYEDTWWVKGYGANDFGQVDLDPP